MPQPLTTIVIAALFAWWLVLPPIPFRVGPVEIGERSRLVILAVLGLLFVVVFVLPSWDALYAGACPSGQHLAGTENGTKFECLPDASGR